MRWRSGIGFRGFGSGSKTTAGGGGALGAGLAAVSAARSMAVICTKRTAGDAKSVPFLRRDAATPEDRVADASERPDAADARSSMNELAIVGRATRRVRGGAAAVRLKSRRRCRLGCLKKPREAWRARDRFAWRAAASVPDDPCGQPEPLGALTAPLRMSKRWYLALAVVQFVI